MSTSSSHSLSFLPTPAFANPNNENLPPIFPPPSLTSPNATAFRQVGSPNGLLPVEEYFSPLRSPVATDIRSADSCPPRQSIPSASQVPPARAASVPTVSLTTNYIEQSRLLLEQQRKVFEQERQLFQQERAMWETERKVLQARIAELESAAGPFGKRSGISTPLEGYPALSLSTKVPLGAGNLSSQSSRQTTPLDQTERFWEGGSSRKSSGGTSRTFSSAMREDHHLPSISENAPSLGKEPQEISPGASLSPAGNSVVGNGIDISLVEKELDGISLKPTALPPEIVAKVTSPSAASPLRSSSPSRAPNDRNTGSENLAPPVDNLTMDAGHTPPAPRPLDENTSAIPTPRQTRAEVSANDQELPPPIPEEETDGDVELRGPLGLTNVTAKDEIFLNQLNSKLVQAAEQMASLASETSSTTDASSETNTNDNQEGSAAGQEPEVKLKFKRSMNFGSAFGSSNVGRS
ncbi:hypothetical protein L228DRAFT_238812 [Xylona heveae TC161]|uniref:Uncharacterized protein n=1 Tax=Xylona heveae (strain CBS 132557 / TC161) TaxID=1328760 RepID=A0A165H2Y7_XYLHT|nr:hypothetical protein L228DRAFT_238812 [Xylona heveae TC161]KZF22914.1 hypothetical protein L228DRAFT_238812 [Xylona heveae TC161]